MMIPEKWAAGGHCPLCNHTPLQLRPTLEADQLACARCGVAFEMEDGGPQIRVMALPPAASGQADGAWRTPKETREWVRALTHTQPHPDPKPAPAEAAPLPPVSPPPAAPVTEIPTAPAPPEPAITLPAEALDRAHRLFELGQTPAQIQVVLERAETWTREQIQSVMEELLRWDTQRKARQRRALLIAFSAIAGLTLIFVVAIVLLMPSPGAAAPGGQVGVTGNGAPAAASGQTEPGSQPGDTASGPSLWQQVTDWVASGGRSSAGSSSSAPASGGGNNGEQMPAALQTLAPPGVRVVEAPTPEIRRGDGPASSTCPASKEEAALLFGGQPDQWQAAENVQGWMLFSTSGPVTVRVPANMTLGYLEIGESLSIRDIPGPATVTNVYLGAVSCE